MNIILIVIDTLRYDHVGAHGRNERIRTPNLDRLAETSLVFDHAYASSYPTIPHRTDVMTGRYGDPFHAWAPLRFDVPTLPRLLADGGYCTQLIHDTPHLVNGGHAFDHPFHAWTFVRGAEVDRPRIDDEDVAHLVNWAPDPVFDLAADPEMRTVADWTVITYSRANRGRKSPDDWNAAKLFDAAAGFLRDNAKREDFFLWVDCFDPHEPWEAPPEFVRMHHPDPHSDGSVDPRSFLETVRKPVAGPPPDAVGDRLRACYAAKVSWMDHCLGRLFDALEATGLDRNTAIIVTSDHGTNLGERGIFGKSYPVCEAEAHVPLFVHVPGGSRGRTDRIVQPQDIHATILRLPGMDVPADAAGQDLLSDPEEGDERRVALSGRPADEWGRHPDQVMLTVFDREWGLHLALRSADCRLFRHGSIENVAADHPEVVRRLRGEGLQELARRGARTETVDWLKAEGAMPAPEPTGVRHAPAGWSVYWPKNYNRW